MRKPEYLEFLAGSFRLNFVFVFFNIILEDQLGFEYREFVETRVCGNLSQILPLHLNEWCTRYPNRRNVCTRLFHFFTRKGMALYVNVC